MSRRPLHGAAVQGTLGRACLVLVVASALSGCAAEAAQRREREALAREASADELMRKGEASASVGDLTRAEQYFVAALKSGGDQKLVIERLLEVCVAAERYPVAIDYGEQYLHHHPHDVEVEFALASLHAATGDRERARKLLENVLHQRPEWSEAHYALATVLRDQGDPSDQADLHDLEYLKLNPKGPLAEMVRARLSRAVP